MAGGIEEELAEAGFADAVVVGRGGSGVVYRCAQKSLGRSVAVKVLGADLDDTDRERFLREGLAMGALSGHPNIVNILQVGVTDSNRPFIVMPYHAAGSLAERVRRDGRVAWPDVLRIGVKLCGALETAHRSGTLHRDIKPGNILVNDYGEPQLSDFGTARIAGGFKTVTGFFTGTLSYTAPEVLAGSPPTAAADLYSLASTLYALIAGHPPHERRAGEDLIAHYLRITSETVPDLRESGIPADVCAAIERAMAVEPADRPASAEEFGRELQLAQRHNGLAADTMALTESAAPVPSDSTDPLVVEKDSGIPGEVEADRANMFADTASIAPSDSVPATAAIPVGGGTDRPNRRDRRLLVMAIVAASAAVVLVVSAIFLVMSPGGGVGPTKIIDPSPTGSAGQPAPEWRAITDARFARSAVASTASDGTIWVFGGIAAGGEVSGAHEGYDPPIDSWKGGDDLPVPVQHAMAVTWSGTPVVLGGWRVEGTDIRVATDRVWRVVNSKWVELPPLLQPRAAAAAAVVGDRIIVTGGVDARGRLITTTEIFDGKTWTLGAPIPTPRQLLAVTADERTVYAVGGSTGTEDLATVEAYDPVADRWTALPDMPQARSDLGVAIADSRLVAVGGVFGGEVLDSVTAFDLLTRTWSELPPMGTPRHGMAFAAVGKSVYAIGGSTGVPDADVTASAEALKLPARVPQPAAAWRLLPDAPTPRLMMAGTVLNGKIWIAGGIRDGETLATVQTFDPATGAWQSQPDLPVPLHHATAAAYRGEIVVIGGTTDNIADASNRVFVFRSGAWAELPPLLHGRAAPAAAVVGDKLVVVGGQDDKQLVPQTEVFDGTAWTDAADLPVPREHLAAVSDGQYVYAVGGRLLTADENSSAFERFDPATGTWETLPELPTPRGSYGAAVVDGRIVTVGGEMPTRVLATVEMYDIASGTWSTLAPLNTPVHGQVVATVGTTVYCIGGADRPTHEGAVATVEALDFT